MKDRNRKITKTAGAVPTKNCSNIFYRWSKHEEPFLMLMDAFFMPTSGPTKKPTNNPKENQNNKTSPVAAAAAAAALWSK